MDIYTINCVVFRSEPAGATSIIIVKSLKRAFDSGFINPESNGRFRLYRLYV